LGLGQLIELVEFGLQELSVRQARLIFGHERRRHRPAQGVLDDFLILRRTKEYANRWLFMRLLHVAIEGLLMIARLWLQDNSLNSAERIGCARYVSKNCRIRHRFWAE